MSRFNGKRYRRRTSKRAARFIGRKIRTLAHEGMRAPRRVAAAYALARRRGFKVPRKNPRGFSESAAWSDVRRALKEALFHAPLRATALRAHVENALRTAEFMLAQVKRGIHENPTLAVLGNPGRARVVGTLSRRLYELRYKHAKDGKDYRHPFGPGASVVLLSDGNVLIRAKHRLWEDI